MWLYAESNHRHSQQLYLVWLSAALPRYQERFIPTPVTFGILFNWRSHGFGLTHVCDACALYKGLFGNNNKNNNVAPLACTPLYRGQNTSTVLLREVYKRGFDKREQSMGRKNVNAYATAEFSQPPSTFQQQRSTTHVPNGQLPTWLRGTGGESLIKVTKEKGLSRAKNRTSRKKCKEKWTQAGKESQSVLFDPS